MKLKPELLVIANQPARFSSAKQQQQRQQQQKQKEKDTYLSLKRLVLQQKGKHGQEKCQY